MPDFRHKLRNAGRVFATNRETRILCGEIRLKQACVDVFNKTVAVFETPGVRIGMDVMLSDYRHWLEYDSVALAVLLIGIGLVELIVLRI
jgi:hypothetical protein